MSNIPVGNEKNILFYNDENGQTKVEVILTPPSVAPAADIPNATHVVTRHVTGKEDEIECPICGKLQRANRTVCWECGAKFNRE